MDIHHFGVAIRLREGRVLVQALHLRVFGLEGILHFGLLIGGEVQMFGQFLSALSWILRAVVPTAVILRGLGLRIGGALSWAAAKGVAIEIAPAATERTTIA